MVSVVNGYTCFSTCDEAKARQGKDPHPSQATSLGVPGAEKKSALDGRSVVTLDGALKDLVDSVDAAAVATQAAHATSRQPLINILV